MKTKFFLALAVLSLGVIACARGDGFIIVERPPLLPPTLYPFAPLEVSSHHVEVKIDGQIAVTSIDQEFYNPNDARLEGTYIFPVPKGAQIDKFSMEIGGKMVEAELLPADKARAIYENIVRTMRDPALLEYAGRDMFKVRIFPIEPHSRKPIKISYSELLRADNGAVTYSYPLSTEKFSARPIKDLSVKVELKSAQPLASIYSPSHKVEIKRDGANRAVIGYEAKEEKPDTDFQLVFSTEARDVGLNLITQKSDGDDGYFLLLAAPTVARETKPEPKNVVFVVDTSGSMAGPKLQQAQKALEFCVANLNAEDRFEIVRFSTEAEPLFGKLVDASNENRKRASAFIADLKPIGGTAIGDALDRALAIAGDGPPSVLPARGRAGSIVIFLTDGLPTVGTRNPDEIVARAKKAAAEVRIFSFGIGSDVNTQLLDQIAESTRAFSQYVLANEDLEVKVSNFFTRIKEPALTNLRLTFNCDVRTSKIYPAELPDLFKGDQLVLAGRYSGSGEVEAKLTGLTNGREQTYTYKLKFPERESSNEFIPRLWATRRVGFLLDEIRIHGETSELREEATELARKFGIVTPYTAYLIVEDEDKRGLPIAHRSLQEMNGDAVARRDLAKAWSGFKEKRSGDDGIANARSQNAFKFAQQAPASIAAGVAESNRGLLAAAPNESINSARVAQYTQQSKFVNGRAFYRNGKEWIDANAQGLTKRQRVQFNSEDYFALLSKYPEAAPWLALGQNVQVALGGTVYEIAD